MDRRTWDDDLEAVCRLVVAVACVTAGALGLLDVLDAPWWAGLLLLGVGCSIGPPERR